MRDLDGEQRAALPEYVGRRLEIDARAGAHEEHREDGQRAGEQRAGEGTEEFRRRPGANVASSAPHNSGTTIMPPGTRSMARLMGICVILPSPAGAVSVAP